MNIKRSHHNKKIIIGLVTVLLLGGIVYGAVAYTNHFPPFSSTKTEESDPPFGSQKTSLEKSDSEKQAIKNIADNPDQKLTNSQADTPSTPAQVNNKEAVNVLLTNAGIYNGTVSASGMVTDIVEEGGKCTFTFTNGSNVVTKVSDTLTNPTSTACKTVSFPSSELSTNGTWKVSLSYTSSTASGQSASKEFTK